jgi:hypothetical protein
VNPFELTSTPEDISSAADVVVIRLKLSLTGKNTLKHVAHPLALRRLLNEIRPSYFCMIPLLIHNPSPVPFVDLVLKNGSNNLLASWGFTPDPVSTIDTLMPRLLKVQSYVSRTVRRSLPPFGIA